MVQHCDDDDLAVMALGETANAADETHLQQCARCRSRLDQLTAVVGSARGISDDDRPMAPPPSVWTGITEELGISTQVTPLLSGRRRAARMWWVAGAAAAVGLVLGALATTVLTRSPGADVVAQATLAPMGDAPVTGQARIERTSDGTTLRVQVPGLPQLSDGYYEVWMATPDTKTMVSLGTLNPGSEGSFTLPAGMDVTDFPVVDVSVEAFDGVAEHSATSLVRGSLGA